MLKWAHGTVHHSTCPVLEQRPGRRAGTRLRSALNRVGPAAGRAAGGSPAQGRSASDPAVATSPSANGHGYGITRLYTSPMRRCLQTTQPIARALGLAPEVWVDIHEHGGIWLDHGEAVGRRGYPGITRSVLSAEFPGYTVPDRVSEAGWWRGAYEELEAAEARAERVAETLRGWGSLDEKIALVSHGTFGSLLLSAYWAKRRSRSTTISTTPAFRSSASGT